MKNSVGDEMMREVPEERFDNDTRYLMTVGGYNEDGVIYSTGTVRTTSVTSPNQENYSAVGMYLFWELFAQPVTGTITLFVDARNPTTLDYTAIWQSATLSATGTITAHRKYLIYPGAVDDGSQLTGVDRIPMPRNWRVRVNLSYPGLNWNYSVGYAYVDS